MNPHEPNVVLLGNGPPKRSTRLEPRRITTMRMTRRQIGILTATTLLSACATVDVDKSVASFDENAYEEDLAQCRGGSATTFMVNGLAGAVVGSALGAFEGAKIGINGGSSAEGALVGSVVGSVIGVGIGAYNSVSEQDEELAKCMREKGYVLDAA